MFVGYAPGFGVLARTCVRWAMLGVCACLRAAPATISSAPPRTGVDPVLRRFAPSIYSPARRRTLDSHASLDLADRTSQIQFESKPAVWNDARDVRLR